MVQMCSSCNERHNHLAEGGSSISIHSESGNLGNGNRCFTPSDNRSQANSDSSYVKFKVKIINCEKYPNAIVKLSSFVSIFKLAL